MCAWKLSDKLDWTKQHTILFYMQLQVSRCLYKIKEVIIKKIVKVVINSHITFISMITT